MVLLLATQSPTLSRFKGRGQRPCHSQESQGHTVTVAYKGLYIEHVG